MAANDVKNNLIEVIFKLEYQSENDGEQVIICGNIPQFGCWQPVKALKMSKSIW